MGDYGQFVWSAYGIVFIGLVWMTWTNLKQAKNIQQAIVNSRTCQQNNKKD